jgi:hypothetical protein
MNPPFAEIVITPEDRTRGMTRCFDEMVNVLRNRYYAALAKDGQVVVRITLRAESPAIPNRTDRA